MIRLPRSFSHESLIRALLKRCKRWRIILLKLWWISQHNTNKRSHIILQKLLLSRCEMMKRWFNFKRPNFRHFRNYIHFRLKLKRVRQYIRLRRILQHVSFHKSQQIFLRWISCLNSLLSSLRLHSLSKLFLLFPKLFLRIVLTQLFSFNCIWVS